MMTASNTFDLFWFQWTLLEMFTLPCSERLVHKSTIGWFNPTQAYFLTRLYTCFHVVWLPTPAVAWQWQIQQFSCPVMEWETLCILQSLCYINSHQCYITGVCVCRGGVVSAEWLHFPEKADQQIITSLNDFILDGREGTPTIKVQRFWYID